MYLLRCLLRQILQRGAVPVDTEDVVDPVAMVPEDTVVKMPHDIRPEPMAVLEATVVTVAVAVMVRMGAVEETFKF